MNSPDDFAGGFLFANIWAFGKVGRNCQRWELVRDILGDVEDDVGTLAGTGLYEEPVPDEGIEVLAGPPGRYWAASASSITHLPPTL